ncbi:hypothetical protein CEUSTIGMA_g730.t1 [Chlamydomonas eustigma]|uniref:Pherophorin domain-containing protein n=1 Tax=Chlamydomonas eustigma TaxID=1157962 RepID=A0A250WRF1_9CHLO|nr:hypothetical protein CEUSTIGMA_g730.t1 [Chlamydomonas eustigma]|eukprot:GAX73276.1 hypothetical protein CEUSTIGMA_g730.t1 [Chlamydomonas eustigma]
MPRFSLASSRNNQCGDFSNASVALRGDQVVAVLPGSGFVDLHNISSGQSLPRSCTVASPPTSVVIEEPPSSKGMPSQPPIMPPSKPHHPPPSSTIHNAPPTVPTSQPILFPVGSPDQSPLYPSPKPSLYSSQPLSPTPSSPSTTPPPSSPFFSVFMFNQSSRLYNESQDCFYLLGMDPSNINAVTHGLLGPYLSNVWNWECSTQSSNTLEGSQLAWSALYLRLDFLQPFYNMLLAQIITSNLGSFWSDAALLPYPFGLAGPVGSSAPSCSFFGMFFSTTVGSLIDPASATPGVVGASFPFYACSETLMGNVVPPQSPTPPIFAIPNGVNLFYPSGIRNSDILGSGPNTQIYPNQTCSIQLKAGPLCPPMSVSPSPPPAPHSPLLEDLPLIPFPPQHPPTYPPKPKVPSPPVPRSPPTCNISISFNKIYSTATNPFNLTSHESDGSRLASLVNEIYTKGPLTTASSVASPQYGSFTYLQPSVLPTQADNTIVLVGVMLADDAQQQQFLMTSLEEPTKMIALAVLFHLSCTDEVWVNSSCSRPDSYLLFTSSPTIVLATLPTGTMYLPNTVLPCPQTPSPPQLLPPLIPSSPLSSPRPHPMAVNPLLPSITPGPLLPQSLPPGPPPSPWSFIAFYNEAYLSCESSEIALEEALKGLCGPNPPVSLSCTDVLNGLVIQLIFLRPVDLDVFYATLTSVNGMGYLIYTSMLSGSLPCGTEIMASSSLVSAVANFSCNSSSASSLSEVMSKLCCSSPSPPPPLLPPTIPPFLPSSPPSAPTVPPLTPPSSPFHDLPSPPRLPQSTSPDSSSPLLRSPPSNITLPVRY